METITIVRHPDIKTYYRISLMMMYNRLLWLFFLPIAVTGSLSFYENHTFVLSDYVLVTVWMAFVYFIFFPVFFWFMCRRMAKRTPTLAETVTYRINAETIEGTTASSFNKNTWKYVVKVVEKKDHIIMHTNVRVFYYFPKAGFESAGDIEKFKEMVKANNIKAYFR